MGSIYKRGDKLWIQFKENGKWVNRSTKLNVGHEKDAAKVLKEVEREVASNAALGVECVAAATVRQYAEIWIRRRKESGKKSANDEANRLRRHTYAALGDMPFTDEIALKRKIIDLIERLKREAKVAPRTIIHIHSVLRLMFADAVEDRLLDVNPALVRRGVLPRCKDKDPQWRSTAVYERTEVERIISSEEIPHDRRVCYALMFLGGLRFGEQSALIVSDYDRTKKPLGGLSISKSYDTKLKTVGSVKTEVDRHMPVHPVLAAILDEWLTFGWKNFLGRDPQSDDLLIPSRNGKNRTGNHMLKKFKKDLAQLGLRPRRQHDLRRTLVSLALDDGAIRDILEWVTHGPRRDIVGMYTTMTWATLCREIAKLQIKLPPKSPPSNGSVDPITSTQNVPPGVSQLGTGTSSTVLGQVGDDGTLLQFLLQSAPSNDRVGLK